MTVDRVCNEGARFILREIITSRSTSVWCAGGFEKILLEIIICVLSRVYVHVRIDVQRQIGMIER